MTPESKENLLYIWIFLLNYTLRHLLESRATMIVLRIVRKSQILFRFFILPAPRLSSAYWRTYIFALLNRQYHQN